MTTDEMAPEIDFENHRYPYSIVWTPVSLGQIKELAKKQGFYFPDSLNHLAHPNCWSYGDLHFIRNHQRFCWTLLRQ